MWVPSELVRAQALNPVVDHLALGIGATRGGAVTGILAAVQNASLVVVAVFVLPAANDAVAVQADFLVQAVLVLQAALDAVPVDAKLTGSTFIPLCTGRSAPPFLADHGGWASSVVFAEGWNSNTSLEAIVRLAGESVGAEAVGPVVLNPADCVRATGVGKTAGAFAHWWSAGIGETRRCWWAIRISVGAFVGVATSWGLVGVADVPLWWTLAGSTAKLVEADGGRVAWVLFDAEVNQVAARDGVALVAVSTAADGGVVPGFADSVGSTAAPHDAGVNALVFIANPTGRTVFVFEAISLDASLPLVQGVTNVSI